MFGISKYNYYEVLGENRVLRTTRGRRDVSEYKDGKWIPLTGDEWRHLRLSWMSDAMAKVKLKACV